MFTSQKVKSMKILFRQISGAVEVREPWSWRKARESGTHKDKHKGSILPKPLAGKMRGADFICFCNQWSSKTGGLFIIFLIYIYIFLRE